MHKGQKEIVFVFKDQRRSKYIKEIKKGVIKETDFSIDALHFFSIEEANDFFEKENIDNTIYTLMKITWQYDY